MPTLRRLYRFLRLVLHVLSGVMLILFRMGPNPEHYHQRDWRIICGWMVTLCRILGLRVTVTGEPVAGPALFVANHISWQDIVVLQSLAPTGFVAKHEIRGWPLIGWMAHRGATLFIRRGKRESMQQLKDAMASRLQARQSLLIFPEGTTTHGHTIKPFRTRLFEPAIEMNLPIQPVAVHYSCKDKVCKDLAFIGEEHFVAHAWRMLGEKQVEVLVHFCEPVDARGRDRRELGQLAQMKIVQTLGGRLDALPASLVSMNELSFDSDSKN
ncbi:MAG TPA: lysophospholipid acyltransferase family protein [Gammaproteobacteria bacterium]|jgi:1-acyl-sn-glycerol-3-phosphate acyltransferase